MSDIFVSQPVLPPLSEFIPLLEKVWESKNLTNNGIFLRTFESDLRSYLDVNFLSVVSNGMLGLTTAIQSLDLKGEVITTPYSFVATTHAIVMSGLTPVFVDINPSDLNIDAHSIEAAITPATSAIMAVHCYGNPCNLKEIEAIAGRYKLKVVYDAAHAFGVKQHGKSILDAGDANVLSFHATKVMNTFEGGAIVSKSHATKVSVDLCRNFGIYDAENIPVIGGNAKMSEMHAAFGTLQLKYVDEAIKKRQAIDIRYRESLDTIEGITPIAIPEDVIANYSYFPIIVDKPYKLSRNEVFDLLKSKGIFSRKYFYPLLSDLPPYRSIITAAPKNLPNAQAAAQKILCLPIYPDLSFADQDRIIQTLSSRR